MLQYVFNTDSKDDEPMMLCAEEQCWDDDTLKQLRDEYNIIFMTGGDGVTPVMVLNKDSDNPILVLGSEDDGTIKFKRRYGNFVNAFSSYWAKFLIADIEEALRICNNST